MAAKRQEIEPLRSYTDGVMRKRIHSVDWSTAPDWALVKISEVEILSGMSRTALALRLKEGTFPAPSKHGKDRCWSLGSIRRWCQAVTAESDKAMEEMLGGGNG